MISVRCLFEDGFQVPNNSGRKITDLIKDGFKKGITDSGKEKEEAGPLARSIAGKITGKLFAGR